MLFADFLFHLQLTSLKEYKIGTIHQMVPPLFFLAWGTIKNSFLEVMHVASRVKENRFPGLIDRASPTCVGH